MTWKDILKAPLSEREMAEVREFMPEEMGRRSVQTFLPVTPEEMPIPNDPKLRQAGVDRRKARSTIEELERRIQSVKSAPPGLQQRSALQLLRGTAEVAGMPDAATKSLADISNFVREMKVRSKGNQSNSGTAA